MGETVISLASPIIPNEGLGGLKVRARLTDLQDLFMGLGLYKKGECRLVAPFEARYRLGDGEIEVCVDVRNGKVFKLTAGPGYHGLLCGKIGVGMGVEEAMRREPSLRYDEAEEAILFDGCPGVLLDVPEVDPLPETVPALMISAISVYASEAFSAAGQKGNW
ncbi:MAG: hypothetical protein M3Y13_13795 [Armatimonadota bacterium]|nr:hypothetical protein [Armatimonadota bacterium]